MARAPRIVLVLAGLVAAVSIYSAFSLSPRSSCRDFSAALTGDNNLRLSVALARTPAEQQRGLAGCSNLKLGQGMYFTFPVKTDAIFWMKDMLMPIDIIWLAGNKVVGITADVPPPSQSQATWPTYSAPEPVDAVLEIGAGHAARLKLKPGTILRLDQ